MAGRRHRFLRRYRGTAIILTALMLAVALATSHHILYASLNNTKVPDSGHRQEIVLTAGSLFAFLVRACLAMGISTAYAQVLWRTLLRRCLRVGTIDSLSSLMSSLLDLLDLRLLLRFPLLWVLALAYWWIALATVFPAGTLSVVIESALSTTANTPKPAFNWTAAAIFDDPSAPYGWHCSFTDPTHCGPSVGVNGAASSVAVVTALQRRLPNFPSLAVNTSYELEMSGPTLQCEAIDASDFGIPQEYEGMQYYPVCAQANSSLSHKPVVYAAWIPGLKIDGIDDDTLPWKLDSTGQRTNELDCELMQSFATNGAHTYRDSPPELYIAVQLIDPVVRQNEAVPWNVTHCTLATAIYRLNLTSNNGEQTVRVVDKVDSPLRPTSQFLTKRPPSPLVTGVYYDFGDYPSTNEIFNHLAMMTIFGRMVVGFVTSTGGTSQPQLFNTGVARTSELIGLNSWSNGTIWDTWRSQIKPAAAIDPNTTAIGPLSDGLEELFQNLTLAMYTLPAWSGYSQSVTVEHWGPQNQYAYAQQRLLISYGVGILVTAVVATFGLLAAFSTGVSHSTKFSTILRVTHWRELEELLSDGSYDGADPVPDHIEEAEVLLGPK